MKEVKIVWIEQYEDISKDVTRKHEENLTKLVNEGWQIIAAGGGRGQTTNRGFVILQRER